MLCPYGLCWALRSGGARHAVPEVPDRAPGFQTYVTELYETDRSARYLTCIHPNHNLTVSVSLVLNPQSIESETPDVRPLLDGLAERFAATVSGARFHPKQNRMIGSVRRLQPRGHLASV